MRPLGVSCGAENTVHTDAVVPAGEVFIAVEKAGSTVQRVPGVVDGRTLWIQQSSTERMTHFTPIQHTPLPSHAHTRARTCTPL